MNEIQKVQDCLQNLFISLSLEISMKQTKTLFIGRSNTSTHLSSLNPPDQTSLGFFHFIQCLANGLQ